jgi:hypothetical protein
MAAQADRDWTAFLKRRAEELVPGGLLAVNLMAIPEGGHAAGREAWEMTRSICVEMAAEGLIDREAVRGVRDPDL